MLISFIYEENLKPKALNYQKVSLICVWAVGKQVSENTGGTDTSDRTCIYEAPKATLVLKTCSASYLFYIFIF